MKSMIELRNVTMAYGDEVVLDGISFSVNPGETKIILGESGSGKSTVLRLILGLERPISGRIFVDGEEITSFEESDLFPIRQKMGMVFQGGALFDSLTVEENVALPLIELRELDREVIHSRVRELLHTMDLQDEDLQKLPSELSGGMRRRVAIARALIHDPRIILYDEPTTGLDPITLKNVVEFVIRLRDLFKVTSILVTHDLYSSFLMSSQYATWGEHGPVFEFEEQNVCLINNRFLVLREGKIIFEGTDEQLKMSGHPYIQELLRAAGTLTFTKKG